MRFKVGYRSKGGPKRKARWLPKPAWLASHHTLTLVPTHSPSHPSTQNFHGKTVQSSENVETAVSVTLGIIRHMTARLCHTCLAAARDKAAPYTLSMWAFVHTDQFSDASCVSYSLVHSDTVYGILQARTLEWVARAFLQGIFPT